MSVACRRRLHGETVARMCCRNNECLPATTAVMEVRDKAVNSADFTTRYNSHAGSFDDNVLRRCTKLTVFFTVITVFYKRWRIFGQSMIT